MQTESPLLWDTVLCYWLFVVQHSKTAYWSHLQRLLSNKDPLPRPNFIRQSAISGSRTACGAVTSGTPNRLNCCVIFVVYTYLLSPWSRVFLEKLVKKFSAFMEPEISLPYSQVPVTCPYPEPAPSSPPNSQVWPRVEDP
jgi:hypothetical protein